MRNTRLCYLGVGLLLGLLLLTSVTQAATWNLADDYSDTNNPTGPWSYGYYQGGTTNVGLYTERADNVTVGWTYKLWTATGGGNGVILKNYGPDPGTDWGYYEVNQIAMAPGELFSGNCPAFARFTAPSDMTVDVSALFSSRLPTGTVSGVSVVKNSTDTLLSRRFLDGFYGEAALNYSDRWGTNPFQAYDGIVVLDAGEYIDFIVDYGVDSSFSNAATGLSVVISEVPEPTTVTLVLLGAAGFIAKRNRKNV